MAYVTQEVITKCRAGAKAIAKKYGVKLSFSGKGDSTLRCKIIKGSVDFGEAKSVNVYHFKNQFTGEALACLTEINDLMHVDHWDKSDIMTDYFNTAFYCDIRLGADWNTPYVLVK